MGGSPDEQLAEVARASAAVREASLAYARYLELLGAVTALWFVSLAWLSGTDPGVLVSGGVFAAAVAAVSVGILPRAGASRHGFTRRFVTAMVGWGSVFAVLLTFGLLWSRGAVAYWLLTAAVVALPAWWGAWVERCG